MIRAKARAPKARLRSFLAGSAKHFPRLKNCSFQPEQGFLPVEPAAVAGEAAARADDAVTREHDRDRVSVHDRADCTRGAWMLCPPGELAVGRHLAVRDAHELLEHSAGEAGGDAHVDVEIKVRPAMLE